jgi:hypothetical protein
VSLWWGLALLLCGCRATQAAEWTEPFDAPALSSVWEQVTRGSNTTLSTTEAPGELRFDIRRPSEPANPPPLTLGRDNLPQIRTPAPRGDFAFETEVNLPEDPNDQFTVGLAVTFGPRDFYLWGVGQGDVRSRLRMEKAPGTAAKLTQEFDSLPLWMRVRRSGNLYSFEWRQYESDPWQVVGTDAHEGEPLTVGLLARTGRAMDLVADFDYLKLSGDGLAVDTSLGRVVAYTKTTYDGTPTWLVARDADGAMVSGLALPEGDYERARLFNLTPGTYGVRAVNPYHDSDQEVEVVVTAGEDAEAKVGLLPTRAYSLTSGTGPQAPAAGNHWSGVLADPRFAGSALAVYLDPSKPDYSLDHALDPFLQSAWLQDMEVPRDLSGEVAPGSLYWYRLPIAFQQNPETVDLYPWALESLAVGERGQVFWNGLGLGKEGAEQGTYGDTERRYVLPNGKVLGFGRPNLLAVRGVAGATWSGLGGDPWLRQLSRRNGELDLRVVDEQGHPVDYVSAEVDQEGGALTRQQAASSEARHSFPVLPEGWYRVVARRWTGMESVRLSGVGVLPIEQTPVTLVAHRINEVSLSSAKLAEEGLQGWSSLMVSPAGTGQYTDTEPAKPTYKPEGVDPRFGVAWRSGVTVPEDVAEAPATPSASLPDKKALLWFRVSVPVPEEWSAAYPGRDLVLGGFHCSGSGEAAYLNGQELKPLSGQGWRSYSVPRSLVRFGAQNVIALRMVYEGGQFGITAGQGMSLGPAPAAGAAEMNPVLVGDANDDGRVGIADAIALLRAVLGMEPIDGRLVAACDLDGDGKVTLADAILLLKSLLSITR